MKENGFKTKNIECDFCVVGGGMAGLCAAIAAARHGAKTVLVQDRPVLGGNASSEIRMWICGAHGVDNKETGLLEEIMLENLYRNPGLKYPVWDTVLYEKARYQENLTLLLNTTCTDLNMDRDRMESIRCWQLTSQTWMNITAKQFADCSGDSVLRISGAEFRCGREARDEFNESHAPEFEDRKTMGNSLLMQLRKVEKHVPFIPPAWANQYTDEELPNRNLTGHKEDNFWWLEIGGMQDTIQDSDEIRDELYRIAYGVWALMKNHPDGRGHEWELDWIGSLPGKRENVRYVGDHILNQNDVEAEGRFDDRVAHGGWSMDDHHPEAIEYPGAPTIFHPAPSPYGIPYRCLYSKNIDNLFMAGRNISATHMAMSSTRVMATCAVLGQAVGTAAAIAIHHGTTPRGVYQNHTTELQESLMNDDVYLPWKTRPCSALSHTAKRTATRGDVRPLLNGIDRKLNDEANAWIGVCGEPIEYSFEGLTSITEARFIFDSDLANIKRMPNTTSVPHPTCRVPKTMLKAFVLEAKQDDGAWVTIHKETNNYQRLVRVSLNVNTTAIRFTPKETWGSKDVTLFSFEVS